MEKAVHTQLYSYLCDNHLLSQKQLGFRLKASTVTATATFTDKILKSMDSGMVTGAVFIDLTKAFDTVNHSILLSKLNSLGVLADSPGHKSDQIMNSSRLACHKAPFWALCYLQYTLMTYQIIWNIVM